MATGDIGIEHQLQGNATVKKKRPGERDLRLHARLESIVGGKDDVLTTHHCGLAEAEQNAVCDAEDAGVGIGEEGGGTVEVIREANDPVTETAGQSPR